jgi:hypothetical protein
MLHGIHFWRSTPPGIVQRREVYRQIFRLAGTTSGMFLRDEIESFLILIRLHIVKFSDRIKHRIAGLPKILAPQQANDGTIRRRVWKGGGSVDQSHDFPHG